MRRSFPAPRAGFIYALFLVSLIHGETEAAAPTLTHLFPGGGQRGTKVAVTCHGSFSWPVKVWAPGLDVVVGKESGKVEVSIPPDLAADRVWLRLYNAEGASALVPFLIGNLKEISEIEPNDRLKNAQPISDSSVVVNGVLSKAEVDGFSVSLKAGQTLVAAVDAFARLGSPMDSVLQIVTPEGIVLAENHDDIQLDPRLAFTAAKTGIHIVRIFAFPSQPGSEIRFTGGSNFVYRLTLTTGPYITHGVGLAAPMTNPGSVEVLGWNIPAQTKLAVQPFGGARFGDYLEREAVNELRNSPDSRLGIALDPWFGGSARIRLTPYPVIPGLTSTDPNKPFALVPSTSLTGCLRKPGKPDEFRLPLKKGQQVIISLESRSLDFPLDPVLSLSGPDGAVVSNIDDTGNTRDAAVSHLAAKDGEYRISVNDRFHHGGDRFFYRLTARSEEPDFELSLAEDVITVNPVKPSEVTVKVKRYSPPSGSVGPITFEAVGLPKDVTITPVISEPNGATSSSVTLKFATTGSPYSGPIRIVGKATKPVALQRSARTQAKLGASFDWVWLTVMEKK